MLKKLSFNNFYSFKEGAVIDFTLGNSVPEGIWQAEGCSTVLGIKGANGSGKTNIIKAIEFLEDFCTFSYSRAKKSSSIPYTNHFGSDDPTSFEVEFSNQGSDFKYYLELKDNAVTKEKLHVLKARYNLIYERNNDELTQVADDIKSLSNYKLKSNASVLSLLDTFDIGQVENKEGMIEEGEIGKAFMFFIDIFTNVSPDGYDSFSMSYEEIAKDLYKDPDAFDFVSRMLKKVDSSLKKIEIEKVINKGGGESYQTSFQHIRSDSLSFVSYAFESSGTKKMFLDMGQYWNALENGELLALDEFDTHYHAMILPEIISLFESSETNKKNAQLIFTAHNTEIIDKLGRYRSILVNKENSESYAYRLDEIPGNILRNDRPISPTYLRGKIGGVPDV